MDKVFGVIAADVIDSTSLSKADLLCLNDIITTVKNIIPAEEIGQVQAWIWMCIDAIERFGNSARGILKDITTNYDGAKLNVEELLKDIKDPAMAEFIKNLPFY